MYMYIYIYTRSIERKAVPSPRLSSTSQSLTAPVRRAGHHTFGFASASLPHPSVRSQVRSFHSGRPSQSVQRPTNRPLQGLVFDADLDSRLLRSARVVQCLAPSEPRRDLAQPSVR